MRPSTASSWLFNSTFPCIPAQFSFWQPSLWPFIAFCRQYNKVKCAAPISVLRSPISPPPWHCARPPHLPIYPFQDKHHNSPLHSALPRTSEGFFSFFFTKYFPHLITLFFLRYWCNPGRSFHPLKAVTWQMEYLKYDDFRVGYP